jgi:predicted secreted protein
VVRLNLVNGTTVRRYALVKLVEPTPPATIRSVVLEASDCISDGLFDNIANGVVRTNAVPPEPSIATLTEANNNTTLSLMPNEKVMVKLSSNPSTGYEWRYRLEGNTRLALTDHTFTNTSAPGVVGGGGIEQWTFANQSTIAGTMRLIFEYKRWWTTDAPSQTVTFNLSPVLP